MDYYASTKKRINKKRFSFLLMLSAVFLLLQPSIPGGTETFSDGLPGIFPNTVFDISDEEPDKINMEEMKIRGKIDKPNIMYIIPRSRLQVDMIIHDEYFLPPLIHAPDQPEPTLTKEPMVSDRALVSSISTSLSHANTQEVKNGSCISCHYFEMALPQNLSTQTVRKELNLLCLQCHPSHYYHICWKEIEKMIFHSGEEALPPITGTGSSYPRDIFFQNMLCKKCHPAWTQQGKSNSPNEPGTFLRPKEYDTDKFCKICHRSKVY